MVYVNYFFSALEAAEMYGDDYVGPSVRAQERQQADIAASQGPLLALENVTLSFGGVTALAAVDLTIAPGEIHAVIGPNGAGKSSLINVISGLYRPSSGRVWVDGVSYAGVPAHRAARLGLSRTFQTPALFKGLSVADNIVTGLAYRNRSNFLGQALGLPLSRREQAEARQRGEEVMTLLRLERYANHLTGALPYGLQKRTELARALAPNPKVLLLDEPMAGMTATEKLEMADYVRAARTRYGTTIVLVEHDVGLVMDLSDRIAVLDYGRKIADGTPEEVRNNQAVIDAYLGVPHDNEQGAGI
ncbi:branched-chain amino acid transport system ATP-binding protein [Rhizobium taibaishanense]|uniref:Branched-chain amino acid transport system ATP-binding protein n=2 Tax=Allorhizobium taibaishanense TaxID=887144 RepID=A0A7W6HS76_9HYPH|nr:branched-chain amino acid transport system ATP-binding protein [Allorhizobium taibaishanense]